MPLWHHHRLPSILRLAPKKSISIIIAAILLLSARFHVVTAHGYLKTPRSRNLVAYQDKNWETLDVSNPKPEDCPHCLNMGGSLAQCGVLLGKFEDVPFERNYDCPLNVYGDPMPSNIQGAYREGQIIEIDVLATTHHKGHFEFAVCPIDNVVPMPVPTEECFRDNKLTFVSDELYGAVPDPNYPERGYIAPASKATWSNGTPGEQPVVGAEYKMKFKLPEGVAGDVVLLQWYYLTANSCKHEGYAEYDFPEEWGSDVKLYKALPDCEDVPEDGKGVPEQFWNCAEIKVVSGGPGDHYPLIRNPDSDAASFVASSEPDVLSREDLEMMYLISDVLPEEAPEPVPCANSDATYYEATPDCTGYYICMGGSAGETYYCVGGDMLYDAAKQMCNWADEVNCAGVNEEPGVDTNGNPLPTQPPTPMPTQRPNAALAWEPVPRSHDKTIIGYYASWQWYDRDGLAEPAAFDFHKITRANFAFFQITDEGYIYGTDSWADPITMFGMFDWTTEDPPYKYCSWDEPNVPPVCSAHNYDQGLIYLAHAAGAEVYPSIGGWSLSDPFPVMAASASARATFASQCVSLIRNYNFDGIDLDWEYPGYAPHSGTAADTVNFNLLLDDVRAALDELGAEMGRFYGLTAALPCGPSIIANQDISHVSSVLTELNLMTYDFHGSWNGKTGVNAPLYDQKGSPEFSVHGCVANWIEGGATKERINIGFPFYGRSFLKAQHLYETHEGNDETTWHIDEGVPQYYNIMEKMGGLTSVRDEQTMTQYVYGKTGMVSYDDERAICDKTEYAQVHGLNGYIIWELSGDLMPDLTTPLLDAANAKLLSPNLDCASFDLSDDLASNTISPAAVLDDGIVSNDPETVYYPMFGSGSCAHDGLEPVWLRPTDLLGSAQACCEYHFSWDKDCLTNSEPVTIDMFAKAISPFYPSSLAHECLSDGNQPDWLTESLYDNAEDCCRSHYGFSDDCVANSIANIGKPTTSIVAFTEPDSGITESNPVGFGSGSESVLSAEAFAKPDLSGMSTPDTFVPATPATTPNIYSNDSMLATEAMDDQLYFPTFKDGLTFCQNAGNPPDWMSGNFFKESKSECCQHYAFEWDYEKCLMDVASSSHAFAQKFAQNLHLYYPRFKQKSCLNDGRQPNWMASAGDYLSDNNWECCHNLYRSPDSLQKCLVKSAAMPACAGCPLDMNDFYSKDPAMTTTKATGAAVIQTTARSTSTSSSLETTTKTTSTASREFAQNAAHDVSTSSSAAAAVESVLEAHQDAIDSEILLYQSPTMEWLPSSVYRFSDLLAALRVMHRDGVAGKYFFMGDDSPNGHVYGLVNIAAFLAQSMKETIKYNACDENSWDLVSGGYPLSNACGQLGQSYQDYSCADHEKHMECPVRKDMTITATTNAKWWGAPAPLFCGPKEMYPFTGYWDHSAGCDNAWADPPMVCEEYEGQKGGAFNNDIPSANSGGRTDVEGCCWWGRGVIQTTGVCNFGKLNYYLGARAADEGRDSRYPDINFCEDPGAICASTEHKELKWIAGMFYWVESLQSYSVGGWDYIDELKQFVDNGMTGNHFIDAVSGIVNRGCHNPPCASGGVDGGSERASNFLKVLTKLSLL